MGSKKCSKCKEIKSLSEFSKDKQHFSGRKSACKACSSVYFKQWRQKNIEQVKEQDKIKQIKRTYNVSHEEALNYHNNRTGECPICGNIDFRVIDHCHTTGKIRGFICSACNSLLGYSRDNIKTLENAIKYLKDHYEL